ncbi:autophagy protein atg9 [Savitreella phatthalungensis]
MVDKSEDYANLRRLIEAVESDSHLSVSNHIRQISRVRKQLTRESLSTVLTSRELVEALEGKDVPRLTDVDLFQGLLVQVYLLDNGLLAEGLALSRALVAYIRAANSRKLDAVAARVFFYFAQFAERLGKLQDIRSDLLQAQRTATLRHDSLSLATLITLILRAYLLENDIAGADRFIAKTTFPQTAPNAVIARYLYYLARVRAIQLDYSSANDHLTNAIRKVDLGQSTLGFLQAAHKLDVVVQLLIGDIPEKQSLQVEQLEKALRPYAALVDAVRRGDLIAYQNVQTEHAADFKRDGTATLISRLRTNVLKTGIRGISLSYNRISLRDICLKLGLASEESTEYVVSKAIRENIISAKLDHERAELLSSPPEDLYATDAPQQGFHERIKFCLELRNESVRAMRYTEDLGRKQIQDIEDERRRLEESFGDLDDDVVDMDDLP